MNWTSFSPNLYCPFEISVPDFHHSSVFIHLNYLACFIGSDLVRSNIPWCWEQFDRIWILFSVYDFLKDIFTFFFSFEWANESFLAPSLQRFLNISWRLHVCEHSRKRFSREIFPRKTVYLTEFIPNVPITVWYQKPFSSRKFTLEKYSPKWTFPVQVLFVHFKVFRQRKTAPVCSLNLFALIRESWSRIRKEVVPLALTRSFGLANFKTY